jgi:hypothetical protein
MSNKIENYDYYSNLVYEYIGIKPTFKKISVYDLRKWQDVMGVRESIFFPNTLGIAYTINNKGKSEDRIIIKECMETVLIHEMLHTAGFNPDNISVYLNEGITQLMAEELGKYYGINVFKAYKQRMRYMHRVFSKLLPLDKRIFARCYARASDKSTFVGLLFWKAYGDIFESREKGKFINSFKYMNHSWNKYLEEIKKHYYIK